jgi:hypothetical protein
MSKTLPQQFTLGSSLAIDIFFFLSGMLTTFTLLQRMRKNGKNKFPAPIFILLRLVSRQRAPSLPGPCGYFARIPFLRFMGWACCLLPNRLRGW